MYDQKGNEIGLLNTVRNLPVGKVRDIDIGTVVKDNNIGRMRLCIIRKTDEKADEAMKKAMSDCSKKQRRVCQEKIELHRYIILATSLPKSICAYQIAESYRMRWQVEIAFKRLRSIMGSGHLPKKDEALARAWLHGKLFVALLGSVDISFSESGKLI